MAEQMPEEVRKFAESARAEGWSDDDIIAYMQKQSGRSNTPAEPKMTPRTADLPTIAAHQAGARLGTVYEEGAAPEEGLVSRTAKALNSAANPEGAGDVLGLMLPTTMGAKAIRMGIPAGAKIAEKVGGVVAEGANMLKKHSPLAAMVDVLATRNPVQGAMVAAAPYGAEWAGRTLQRVGSAIKNFKPWEFNANSPAVRRLEQFAQETPEWPIGDVPRPTKGLIGPGGQPMPSGRPDPSFVRGVPAQPAMVERPALPPGARQMPGGPDPSFVRGVPAEPAQGFVRGEPVGVGPTTPTGPILEGEIVQGALPPRRGVPMGPGERPDPSFVRAEPAQYATVEKPPRKALPAGRKAIEMGPGEAPDTSYVRGEPATVATVEGQAPTFRQEVKRLAEEGLGAEDIADKLRGHPELAGTQSRAELINRVREARGGPAGQIPAGAKKAIDAAIAKLQTVEEKRAYLMRAPNGAVYDYIRGKLGL